MPSTLARNVRSRRPSVASTRPARRQLVAREADRDREVERAGRQVVGETGRDPDIGEIDRLRRVQEDRAGDPAVPPLVLVLDERRVGPFDDAQAEGVRARPEPAGQVELRGEVRVLADPDLLAVELDDEDALRGADIEHHAPARPGGRHLELAFVDAGRVELGDRRRPVVEGHLDVGVVRLVPGPRHRPDARDLRLGPVAPTSASGDRRSWKRQRPSSGRLSRCATLCMGNRPIPVTSGRFHGPVTRRLWHARSDWVRCRRPIPSCSTRPVSAGASATSGRSAAIRRRPCRRLVKFRIARRLHEMVIGLPQLREATEMRRLMAPPTQGDARPRAMRPGGCVLGHGDDRLGPRRPARVDEGLLGGEAAVDVHPDPGHPGHVGHAGLRPFL